MTSDTNVLSKTQALICEDGDLGLAQIPLPPLAFDQIRIDVKAIGLCRTDLYAIAGEIPTWSKLFVPGHEFSGVVSEKGSGEIGLAVGDRVVVNPLVSCSECGDCKSANGHLCSQTAFMGVDFDGACCDQITVNQSWAYRIPDSLSFVNAVFAEPIAATLAILKANIYPEQKGLLIGDSRITELAQRVLIACKFKNVEVARLDQARGLSPDRFDFVIETEATTAVFVEMARLVRPRGTMILKSRQHLPIALSLREIIQKEPTISVVNYGRFDHALQLLVDGSVKVDDLVGKQFALDDYADALALAAENESKKIFIVPGN